MENLVSNFEMCFGNKSTTLSTASIIIKLLNTRIRARAQSPSTPSDTSKQPQNTMKPKTSSTSWHS